MIDALLPLDGFHRYAANVQVPTALSYNGGKPMARFDYCLTVNHYPDNASGANNAGLYFTNMLAEPGSEDGPIGAYTEGDPVSAWQICRTS